MPRKPPAIEPRRPIIQKKTQKIQQQQQQLSLPLVEDIPEFVSSNLRSDCVLIISQCSTFKAISDEK
jgi:dephospho-CoA kinase